MATTFLPDVVFPPPQVGGSGQLPASDINDLANTPRDMTTTVAARGALVPLLYGERDVPGLVFAVGSVGSDLLIGFLWCLGECQSIEAVYFNDAAVPGGVTLTDYLGTPTQTVDPTLAANIAAYNDRMRVPMPGGDYIGICYTVARIPPGVIDGFPRARAHIKGRKVYDPRVDATLYRDNPALCVADLIENTAFGLGRTTSGVSACADWCDSLLGGVAGAYRARVALYIANGRPAEEYVDLLCEYAECLRVYEGETVKLIPDQPVDLGAVPVVDADKIMAGSLSLQAESSTDTPTQMELQYTVKPTDLTQPWGMEPVTVSLAGVDEGEVQRIPTSVSMEGVTREIEAANKAMARLMRMQNRMTATWTTRDKGVTHQRGDVVMIDHPARGVSMPVRIVDVNLVSPGRYQVTAKRYDANHYPADIVLPSDEGVVPVGAIGMLVGTTVPDGWELFSAADGRYIVGAGGALAVGDTGGTSTLGPFSGTSGNGGDHVPGDLGIPQPNPGSTPVPYGIMPKTSALDGYVGYHTHAYTTASAAENFLRRENALVRKITADGLTVPPTVRVWGLPNITTTATKNIGFAGRLLKAAAASANAGASSQSLATTLASTAAALHDHYTDAWSGYDPFGTGGSGTCRYYVESMGAHGHGATFTAVHNLQRRQLCAFDSGSDFVVTPGVIMAWAGSVGALPPDWVLCDGASGTPDMRDRFVEFAGTTPAAPAGNNTVTLTGLSDSHGHTHDAGAWADAPVYNYAGHSGTVYHDHYTTASHAFTPAYYALAFIMFAPS